MEYPIGVIDSGVGGASILKALTQVLPHEKYVFIADTLNAPYGNKTSKEIIRLTMEMVDFLVLKRCIKLLVVACNTSSATAKQTILSNYPHLPCVFVEPPIKMAIDSNKKHILILATKRTLQYNKTIKYYAKKAKEKNIKITKVFIKNLAKSIDDNYLSSKAIDNLLKDSLKPLNYDAIILGCTHYNFIKDNLKKLFPKSEIISCEKSVAQRAKNLIFQIEGKYKDKILIRKSFENVELILTAYNSSVMDRLRTMFPGSVSACEKE